MMAKEKPRFKRFVGAKPEERVDKFDATHSTSKVPRKSKAVMIRRQNRLRTAVQVIFTALTNGYAAGFAKGQIFRGASKQTCVPGLNCYSCPGAVGSCPIGSLQAVIGKQNHRFSFYVIGTLMIFGSLMGRFICGWLCPFGLVQDLLFKVPFPKKIRDFNGDKLLRYLKYLILIIFVIGMPILVLGPYGASVPWFCKLVCPSGSLTAGIPLVASNRDLQNLIGVLFSWKMILLSVIIFSSIIIYRPFCKFLCPLGAIYGIFNKFSLYQYEIDESRCVKCGGCHRACHMGVKIYENPTSAECIRCGKCIEVCPKDAISTKKF